MLGIPFLQHLAVSAAASGHSIYRRLGYREFLEDRGRLDVLLEKGDGAQCGSGEISYFEATSTNPTKEPTSSETYEGDS